MYDVRIGRITLNLESDAFNKITGRDIFIGQSELIRGTRVPQ
jgi:hypothetical protein